MRLPEAFLRCVVFICEDEGGGESGSESVRKVPVATGFKIAVPATGDLHFIYVVTARHVIEDSKAATLYIRINTMTGGFEHIPTQRFDWITSADADVAVIRMEGSAFARLSLDNGAAPMAQLVDEDGSYRGPPIRLATEIGGVPISLGDDIFFLGLFAPQVGAERNIPIARFGNISALPADPLEMPRFGGASTFKGQAYLAECHSWSGHSGSPVFWAMWAQIYVEGVEAPMEGMINGLVGLDSGHFPIRQKAQRPYREVETDINSGISIITPASKIKALLMREDIVKEREDALARDLQKKDLPTMDSARETADFSRDDFLRDLRILTKRAHDSLPKPPKKPIKCPHCGGMIALSGRARSAVAL